MGELHSVHTPVAWYESNCSHKAQRAGTLIRFARNRHPIAGLSALLSSEQTSLAAEVEAYQLDSLLLITIRCF